MRFDLHVHTRLSPCSRLSLEEILGNARRLGLDGVCLTDHDTMAAGRSVREGVQQDGLCLIVGMEYSTPEGDILLFGPFEHLRPGLSAREVVSLASGLGGAAVAAHPFRAWRPAGPGLLGHEALAAVEVENGRNSLEENAAAVRFAARRGLPALAGSDAHSLEELGARPVDVAFEVRCRTDLVAALLAGRCAPVSLAPPACRAAVSGRAAGCF
ncbi:PHP domain-containing protein [Solidesulfovibrio sp.]|uniref:PHP-associated domain-containing protein n=1 Tax=Solidesulfovibrio sp. TaxID=2910990 RepID=UPI0026081C18|nr:PHP domain-containing protein [Solidesulfovibrio sp.]